MIRINLLATREKPSAARGPQISLEGAKLTALFLIIIGLGVAALFGHFYILKQEESRLTEELRKEEAEKTRLAKVKAELEVFEKRQQFLIKRFNIIEGLRKSQSGPVTLLNTVASTVIAHEQLWLTAFDNDGVKVTMEGVAGSVNIIADFIASLNRSGQFKSVEIKDSYQDEKYKDVPTFVFSITAELLPPPPAATPTPPAGAAPAGPRT